jgi:hypothetical protein
MARQLKYQKVQVNEGEKLGSSNSGNVAGNKMQ